jgi:hypothetical protein
MVHIHFCFDKSEHNFSVRKFQSTLNAILNPVNAAMSIIQRADLLGVPVNEPIGVYSLPEGPAYQFCMTTT